MTLFATNGGNQWTTYCDAIVHKELHEKIIHFAKQSKMHDSEFPEVTGPDTPQ